MLSGMEFKLDYECYYTVTTVTLPRMGFLSSAYDSDTSISVRIYISSILPVVLSPFLFTLYIYCHVWTLETKLLGRINYNLSHYYILLSALPTMFLETSCRQRVIQWNQCMFQQFYIICQCSLQSSIRLLKESEISHIQKYGKNRF